MMKRIFIAIAGLFIVMLVVLAIVLRPLLSHQSPPGEAFFRGAPASAECADVEHGAYGRVCQTGGEPGTEDVA